MMTGAIVNTTPVAPDSRGAAPELPAVVDD